MKKTIANNNKSFNILNKLILNGFYNGIISPDRFELSRKRGFFNSMGNCRIVGVLNNENKFELNFDLKFPLDFIVKIAFGIGIVFSIVSISFGNWFLPIPFFIIPFLIMFITFKLEKKKEIRLFASKFLELYKSEYKTE